MTRSRSLKQHSASATEDLDFKLWNLGFDESKLAVLRKEAESINLSLIVYLREYLGISVGGEPKVKLPIAYSCEYLLLDEQISSRAYDLQRSPHVVRYLDYYVRLEDSTTHSDFEKS